MLERRAIILLRTIHVIAFLALSAGVAGAAPRIAAAVKIEQAPVLDGKLDDACWKGAGVATDFIRQPEMTVPAPVETRALIAYDERCIYFGIACHETDKAKKFVATASGRDARIWFGDIVEIFLDVRHDHGTYYQFAANSGDGSYESHVKNKHWNGDWQCKSTTSPGLWCVEIAIPFKCMGWETPMPGTVWGINLYRTRRTNSREYMYWSPVGLDSHAPQLFGDLIFGDRRQWARKIIAEAHERLEAVSSALGENPFLADELTGDLSRYRKDLKHFEKAAKRASAFKPERFSRLYDRGDALAANILATKKETELAMMFERLRR